MIYEIQMEYIPGNNQIWVSFVDESNKPLYQYDALEAAQAALPALEILSPNYNFRIIEK